MPDDLRERIAAAIEERAARLEASARDSQWTEGGYRQHTREYEDRAEGLREAARIARETPDSDEADGLKARIGELEEAAHEAEVRDVHEPEAPDHG